MLIGSILDEITAERVTVIAASIAAALAAFRNPGKKAAEEAKDTAEEAKERIGSPNGYHSITGMIAEVLRQGNRNGEKLDEVKAKVDDIDERVTNLENGKPDGR